MSKEKFISSIWNFDTNEDYQCLTHKAFRWYGKLVPQLVSKVLDLYVKPNDTVLANFSGSGTIALECLRKSINCISTDINPLAILIAKVKTLYIHIDNVDNYTDNIIEQSKKLNKSSLDISHLYQPEKWYNDDDFYKLVALRDSINKVSDINIRNFYLACLMSIVRDCSTMDSRCVNHIVVDKNKNTKDVYEYFKKSVLNLYNEIQSLKKIKSKNVTNKIIQNSAENLDFIEDNSIDLVFSHPPYLNAVNYYNIYRLCTDLLDNNYVKIRQNDFSAKNLNNFLEFMERTFIQSYRILKPGKRCVVVIGDVRFHGNIIPLQVEFVNLLRKNNFVIEDIFIWQLNNKAGMSLARKGNHIDHNFIIVAKKEEHENA